MLILGSGCGWIPNATVNFIANLVGIIKIFVPLLIIIMGSIDFAKAVMSQKDDDIKKSQTNFIQKLIAGVAVFFVMIFISWVFKIIGNADSSLNANNAIRCVNLMLNGGYQAEDIDTLAPPDLNWDKSTTTKTTVNYNNSLYYDDYEIPELLDDLKSEECKTANCNDQKLEFCTRLFSPKYNKDCYDQCTNTIDFATADFIAMFSDSNPNEHCRLDDAMIKELEKYNTQKENDKKCTYNSAKSTCECSISTTDPDYKRAYQNCLNLFELNTCNIHQSCNCRFEDSKAACLAELSEHISQNQGKYAVDEDSCKNNIQAVFKNFCEVKQNKETNLFYSEAKSGKSLNDVDGYYVKLFGVGNKAYQDIVYDEIIAEANNNYDDLSDFCVNLYSASGGSYNKIDDSAGTTTICKNFDYSYYQQ